MLSFFFRTSPYNITPAINKEFVKKMSNIIRKFCVLFYVLLVRPMRNEEINSWLVLIINLITSSWNDELKVQGHKTAVLGK